MHTIISGCVKCSKFFWFFHAQIFHLTTCTCTFVCCDSKTHSHTKFISSLGRRIVVEHSIARQLPLWGLKFDELQQSSSNCRLRCTRVEKSITNIGQKTFELLRQIRFDIATDAGEHEEETFDLEWDAFLTKYFKHLSTQFNLTSASDLTGGFTQSSQHFAKRVNKINGGLTPSHWVRNCNWRRFSWQNISVRNETNEVNLGRAGFFEFGAAPRTLSRSWYHCRHVLSKASRKVSFFSLDMIEMQRREIGSE